MDLSSILNPEERSEDAPSSARNDCSLVGRTQAQNGQVSTLPAIHQPIRDSSRPPGIMSQIPMSNLTGTPHNTTLATSIPPNPIILNGSPSPAFNSPSTKKRVEEWLGATVETGKAKKPRLEEKEGSSGEQMTQASSFATPVRPTLVTPEKRKTEASTKKIASRQPPRLSVPRPPLGTRKRPSTDSKQGPPKKVEVPVSYERTKKVPRPPLGKRPASKSKPAPAKGKQSIKHVFGKTRGLGPNQNSDMRPGSSPGTSDLAGIDGNSGRISAKIIETIRRLKSGEIETQHEAEDLQIIQAFVKHVKDEGSNQISVSDKQVPANLRGGWGDSRKMVSKQSREGVQQSQNRDEPTRSMVATLESQDEKALEATSENEASSTVTFKSSSQASKTKSTSAGRYRQSDYPVFSLPLTLVVHTGDSVPTETSHCCSSPSERERNMQHESPALPNSPSASALRSPRNGVVISLSPEHTNKSQSPSVRRLSDLDWLACPILSPERSVSPYSWRSYAYNPMRSLSSSGFHTGQHSVPPSPTPTYGRKCYHKHVRSCSPQQKDSTSCPDLGLCFCGDESSELSDGQEGDEGSREKSKPEANECALLGENENPV